MERREGRLGMRLVRLGMRLKLKNGIALLLLGLQKAS